MDHVPFAVVGGGISGLAAAFELQRQGVPFLLFESSDRLGGLIRTERVDGFTLDAGADSLLVEKPAAIELCRELDLADRLVPMLPPRRAYVLRRGRLRPLPHGAPFGIPASLAALAGSDHISWSGRLRMTLDLLGRGGRAHTEDESIAAFFRRRFGREAVDILAEPLLAGIHAGNVERLSMRALFPRLVEAERVHGSVIRGMRVVNAARSAARRDGPFRSLPDGLEALPRAIVSALPAASIRRRSAVTSITHARADGPAARAATITPVLPTASASAGGPYALQLTGHTPGVTADQVICALPAAATAQLVGGMNEPIARLCRLLPTTSTAVVALAFPRGAVAHRLDGSGFVVPRTEGAFSILAATWISSKWPARAPDGQVLLRGFVGGARAPELLDRSDDDLIELVNDDLARLLGIRGAPSLTRVYRWIDANPQIETGHIDRLARIDERLASLPGLRIVGAAFRGVGIPDCVAAGRAAARGAVEEYRRSTAGVRLEATS
ncbi:MAG: protoporphyrinogen oxidase [Acidobacteria bacterium]|nr:protoporphyrinogen oxidase [Acidobacteriota bacterium]MYJ03371.1 protoporphyrinogen oxidase [Acidobacteriota bacterium]